MNVKSAAKRLLPARALKLWTDYMLRRAAFNEAGRNLEDIFTEIYLKNRWGGKKGELYSGTGSDASATQVYVDFMSSFIKQNGVSSVLDIGCGDFRVGQQLVATGITYIGADIVRPLIERNNAEFGSARVRFVHIDVIEDALPNADLCLIRQVLQHLSNAQVSIILEKLTKFKFALISEHHPAKLSDYNLDKPAGAAIRAYKGSGVYLEKPPFSRNAKIVFETSIVPPLVTDGEKIVTYLLTSA